MPRGLARKPWVPRLLRLRRPLPQQWLDHLGNDVKWCEMMWNDVKPEESWSLSFGGFHLCSFWCWSCKPLAISHCLRLLFFPQKRPRKSPCFACSSGKIHVKSMDFMVISPFPRWPNSGATSQVISHAGEAGPSFQTCETLFVAGAFGHQEMASEFLGITYLYSIMYLYMSIYMYIVDIL